MSEAPIRTPRAVLLTAGLIIAAHLALLFFTAREKSLTADEPYHIARGIAALDTGDFRLSVPHPPLLNIWNALPAYLLYDLHVPAGHPDWNNPHLHDADRKDRLASYLLAGNPHYLGIAMAVRAPTMVLSAILGLLVFFSARKLYGPLSGLAALALYSFSPTTLAHGCLDTTDTGSALFIFLFAIALSRRVEKPTALNLALAGVALGAAQLSKFTAVLLFPLTPLALFAALGGTIRERAAKTLTTSAAVFAIGFVCIWAGYGFEIKSFQHLIPPPELAPLASPGLLIKQLLVRAAAYLNLPPGTYFHGLATTLLDTSQHGKPLYFLGKVSEQGWWYYYPVLFLIKEPLSFLGLLGTSSAARGVKAPPAYSAVSVVTGAGIFLFFVIFNSKDIGIRHLLPIYPFLFVFASRALSSKVGPRFRAAAGVLLLLYAANGVRACPDYLVHFNSLAGGPDGGLKISVVGEDWGQDVAALGEYLRENRIAEITYLPYGNADPAAYGVNFKKFGCHERPPGYYAIHVVDLRRPTGLPGECFEDFLRMRPAAVLHHTIYLFRVGGSAAQE